MARLDTLLDEADELISKRLAGGQEKTGAAVGDDDIFKLAEEVRNPAPRSEEPSSAIVTLTEKVAHALAISETMMNLPVLVQIDQLTKTAQDKGISAERIDAYIEKLAKGKLQSILNLFSRHGGKALTAGGAVAATGGVVTAHRKGEEKGVQEGYVQALKDVNKAWDEYGA